MSDETGHRTPAADVPGESAPDASASEFTAPTEPRLIAEVEIPDPGSTQFWTPPTWSADGKRIFVERYVDSQSFPWLDKIRAEIGGFAVALGVVIALWWLVRTLRRPRLAGRRYCRRCNHDVNVDAAAPIMEGKRCTECGVVLTPRRIAAGRRLRSRLIAALVPAVALAGAGLFLMHGKVGTQPLPHPSGFPIAWPVAALEAMRGWPLWRKPPVRTTVFQVDVYELTDTGEIAHVGAARMRDATGSREWVASQDGRIMAWVGHSDDFARTHEVHWCETDSGAVRSVVLDGTPGYGFSRIEGFTPDGRGVVVHNLAVFIQSTNNGNTRTWIRDEAALLVVDVESGAVRRVTDSKEYVVAAFVPRGDTAEFDSFIDAIAAVGDGPQIEWAVVTLRLRPVAARRRSSSAPNPTLHNLTVAGPDAIRRVEFAEHDLTGLSGLRTAMIAEDRWLILEGEGCEIFDQVAPHFRVDLLTGQVARMGSDIVNDGEWWDPSLGRVHAEPSPDGIHAALVMAQEPDPTGRRLTHYRQRRSQTALEAMTLRVLRR